MSIQPVRTQHASRAANPLISIVLPAFNESAVLRELHERISAVMSDCGQRYEILFVNDGSTDQSMVILDGLAAEFPEVRVLHFSRNFGHQAAVKAGLDYARGDAVIVMDSDLQDDPAAIAVFLEQWQNGFDVVYAVRHGRKENAIKRMLFYGFYRALNAVSNTKVPMDAGNFGLLDKAVVRQLGRLTEHDRYFPGLRSWVGFRQVGVPVERLARHDDQPRVTLRGLFRLAKTAVISFSHVPLSIFYAIAAMSFCGCIGLSLIALSLICCTTISVPVWMSFTIVASLFGTLNALGIAVLGEYVVRIYDQVRGRPTYLVARAGDIFTPSVPIEEESMLELIGTDWSDGCESRRSQERPSREQMAAIP